MPKSSPVWFSIAHLTTSFPGSLWKRGCALQSNLDLCELKGPDNRKCLSECHATLVGVLRENQWEPSEIRCISNGACEHETRTDLCYEVKQIQFLPEFRHIIWWKKKKICCGFKIWLIDIHEEPGQLEEARENTREIWIIEARLYPWKSYLAKWVKHWRVLAWDTWRHSHGTHKMRDHSTATLQMR